MTGLGAMMAGGNPADGREEDDFYPTPWEPTEAFLDEVTFDGIVHENACGDGAMAKQIAARGYEVRASDLVNRGYGVRRNFFTIKKPVAHNLMSNPPWNLAEEFIRHGLSLNPRKMAYLLKASYFHAASRIPLFNEHPPSTIYPLTWRIDFKNKGRPVIECAWYLWERGIKRHPEYKLLRRPSADRKPDV